jgi:ribosomal protein L7/L12
MSKICSLVVLYKGRELTQEAHDAIVTVLLSRGIINIPDDVQIRYYDGESIADAILANEHKQQNASSESETEIHFVSNDGGKLKIVKLFKDEFNLELREAREIVDRGVIRIKNINYPIFLKNLYRVGARAVNLDSEHALMQAVIYINERYPNAHMGKKFLSTLIKDVLDAKDSSNAFSIALIESIRLISNAQLEECEVYGLNKTIYGNVCVAYNVLANM